MMKRWSAWRVNAMFCSNKHNRQTAFTVKADDDVLDLPDDVRPDTLGRLIE
jgi:hypothetical protein